MDGTFERMKATVRALGFTSNEVFEEACGLGHGFVSRITCRVKKQSLDKISRKFPHVNVGWIKSGRGEMFYRECDRGEQPTPVLEDGKEIAMRVLKFCEYKNITKSEFISKTGIYSTFFTRRSQGLTNTTMARMSTAFPELNINWVINGIGNMVSGENEGVAVFTNYRERLKVFCRSIGISEGFFLAKCGLTATTFSKLSKFPTEENFKKFIDAYPQLNINWLRDGTGEMLRTDVVSVGSKNVTTIPLVPKMAHNGYVKSFGDTDYIGTLPKIPFVVDGHGNHVAFEVDGDSMNDGSLRAYQDGDIVVCREWKNFADQNSVFPSKSQDFIVVTASGVLLKAIVDINRVSETMTVHSFNPAFNDTTLPFSDIKQVFEVEFLQRRKKR